MSAPVIFYNKYFSWINGFKELVTGIITSSGDAIADRYKLVSTGLDGKINANLLPPIASVPIRLTYSELADLVDNFTLSVGSWYFITDRDIFIQALTTNKLSLEGYYLATLADYQNVSEGISGIWVSNTDGGVYAEGQTIIWSNLHYANINLGTNTDTTPDIDITNWQLLPFTDASYQREIDTIEYIFEADKFISRKDKRGNYLISYSGISASFLAWGNDKFFDNYALEGDYSGLINYRGQVSTNQLHSSGIQVNGDLNGGNINGNVLTGSSIENLTLKNFASINSLVLNNTTIQDCTLDSMGFNASTLNGTSIQGWNMAYTNFSGHVLNNATIQNLTILGTLSLNIDASTWQFDGINFNNQTITSDLTELAIRKGYSNYIGFLFGPTAIAAGVLTIPDDMAQCAGTIQLGYNVLVSNTYDINNIAGLVDGLFDYKLMPLEVSGGNTSLTLHFAIMPAPPETGNDSIVSSNTISSTLNSDKGGYAVIRKQYQNRVISVQNFN